MSNCYILLYEEVCAPIFEKKLTLGPISKNSKDCEKSIFQLLETKSLGKKGNVIRLYSY